MLYYNILRLHKYLIKDEKGILENNYFNLLLGVPDTDFAKLIDEAIEVGAIYNEIHRRSEYYPLMWLRKLSKFFLKFFFENFSLCRAI